MVLFFMQFCDKAASEKFIMTLTLDLHIREGGYNSSLPWNNTLWRLRLGGGDEKRKNFIVWNQETQLNWNEG